MTNGMKSPEASKEVVAGKLSQEPLQTEIDAWVSFLKTQISQTNDKLSNAAAQTPEFLLMWFGVTLISIPIIARVWGIQVLVSSLIPEEFVALLGVGSLLLVLGVMSRLYRLKLLGNLASELSRQTDLPAAVTGRLTQGRKINEPT